MLQGFRLGAVGVLTVMSLGLSACGGGSSSTGTNANDSVVSSNITNVAVSRLNRGESVRHAFAGTPSDGAAPYAGLVMDASGNFYGTTAHGGAHGQGTVFKITPAGVESVVYSFSGGTGDGASPYAGLALDASGNLYGTTIYGGTHDDGTVFKITPAGVESVVHTFVGGTGDGAYPYAGLLLDASGNLYGTTLSGGDGGGASGQGTVFKITPAGVESVLYSFGTNGGDSDGVNPQTGLVRDASGNLYGTTNGGGASNKGTVFKITPAGRESIVHSFAAGTDGALPQVGLVLDVSGKSTVRPTAAARVTRAR
ncbi:MAG: hypothetical protein M0Z43_09955 [Acidithiobacillus sp.]|nr:hypothetical protein [Acidithiobacillus sp.]